MEVPKELATMSIWIRIANTAFNISLGSYAGWGVVLSDCGLILHLGCADVALLWNMRALVAASKFSAL